MPDIPVVVQHAPRFSQDEAAALARQLFGIDGTLEPLASERDQNFLVTDDSGARFVLKIANRTEAREILEFQHEAIEHLATHARRLALPRVLRTTTGESISGVSGPGGRPHFVRMLTWVPGVPLARVRPHSRALLRSLGERLGDMDRAFAGFSHPAANRVFAWDVKRLGWVRNDLPRIADPERRAALERCLDRFDAEVAPRLAELRARVIHNDWNDHNVLVSPAASVDREVVGAVDFGDMVHSAIVADLAVAASYAMLNKPDPIAAASAIVEGYHGVLPLAEAELAVLYHCICARLCLSVAMAARQSAAAPDNEYLQISQRQVWALLQRLLAVSPRWAHYVFRGACGLEPCPAGAAVARWIGKQRDGFTRVLDHDLTDVPLAVLDLSVGSLDIPSLEQVQETRAFSTLVSGQMARAGAQVGIGRYDEARLAYTGPRFEQPGNDGPEQRTVHIGVDLFVPPGSPVYAPLDGVVHSVRDNAGPLDYGPTIILEHRVPSDTGNTAAGSAGCDADRASAGTTFYTLYGHLGVQSLQGLEPGAPISRGEWIATIGDTDVNGGWPPHLHFQVIADLLDRQGDFPGVAQFGQRDVWLSVCPDPSPLLGLPVGTARAPRPLTSSLLNRRRARLGRNLSIAYRQPLAIVRGQMQYLFDADGRRYLDAVNNVPHVGHSHPRVARAVSRQIAVLNTNTRYLHENLVAYAERLAALLPKPLRVCYVVCSGSEANELALRLAAAYTRHTDVIVVDGAYHGNTSALVDISPYKFDGPGGGGCPPHVRTVRTPDSFRGAYRGNVPDAGPMYARDVTAAAGEIAAAGRGLSAFICESLLSCAGQIVLPDGYLAAAYRAARAAGGVCIADEVQVGFGRVGTHLWGFETQGVTPDIVTFGKPIGNGFPLAAVVTRPEIAAAFDNGMEYFNTYGGNPVSCAAGLAVLDVMRDERLQEHALNVGAHLACGLEQLKARFPVIGDVRGLGLFLGLEFVTDRATLEPAAGQAGYVVNRLRDRGILVSTDGPLHNVIKIKPPLPFSAGDADRFVETLAEVLAEDPAQP